MSLSIVIPVYNVEEYLRQCLDSLLSQEMIDCEVWAINDGSTDGSLAILEEYQRKHADFLHIVSQANLGLSAARNTGIGQTQGDWVYFLDSDDWLSIDSITILKQSIQQAENSDVIYLINSIKRTDGVRYGKSNKCPSHVIPLLELPECLDDFPMSCVGAYIYKRDFLIKNNLRFAEGLLHEDALFRNQLLLMNGFVKCVQLSNHIINYRIGRADSITTNRSVSNYVSLQKITQESFRQYQEYSITIPQYYEELTKSIIYYLYEAYISGYSGEYKRFWVKQDIEIMRFGAIPHTQEYRMYLLAVCHPMLMAQYLAGDLSPIWRRIINIFFTIYDKIHK